jgi:hypothetical protein
MAEIAELHPAPNLRSRSLQFLKNSLIGIFISSKQQSWFFFIPLISSTDAMQLSAVKIEADDTFYE